MLNELNKNHMGGFDNYGAEDAYNLEDTWDERRQDVKPKVNVELRLKALIQSTNKFILIKLFPYSSEFNPQNQPIQISTTVGDRSTSNDIKQTNSITIPTIHTMSSSQSNINHIINLTVVVERIVSWSQIGMMDGTRVHTIMEVVIIITITVGDTEITTSIFRSNFIQN